MKPSTDFFPHEKHLSHFSKKLKPKALILYAKTVKDFSMLNWIKEN
jgi:hypothetical protein